jgi:DNA-directed RNA polymerase specialized sigma24 family protein
VTVAEKHGSNVPRATRPAAEPALAAAGLAALHLATRIAAAVDSLPLACRAPVRMYLAGYEQAKIADILEWTEIRTRDVLRSALEDLRGLVEDPETPAR